MRSWEHPRRHAVPVKAPAELDEGCFSCEWQFTTQDDLFAYLLVAAARRRGHTAKQIANIGEINDVFTSSPAAIIVGVSALDEGALINVRDLHAAHHESLILVATEDSGARPLIAALERGATDVVHKPVLPGDLITRAEIAAANRGILNQSDDTIRISDLEIDINQIRRWP